MRILVVGGAGYIGCCLVPALLERDYEVEVVDLLWFGSKLPAGVRVQRRDALALAEADLEGFEQVIFLAGLSNDPMAEYSPSKNFIYNAATPAYLAYVAKRAGVRRFIFASSCSVYGYTVNRMCDEDAEVCVSYPYGISKYQGEQAVLQMVDKGFSVVALRKGTVCGHSPRMRFDLVVNTMFKTAASARQVTINNPAIWRPIVAMSDAVRAYVRAVEAHEDISGVFNVASGNFTVGEIGDIVRNEVQKLLGLRVKLNIRHQQDYRSYKVNCDKAARVLSFKPRETIESIVRDLAENRAAYGAFDDPLYTNIEVLKGLDGPPPGMASAVKLAPRGKAPRRD